MPDSSSDWTASDSQDDDPSPHSNDGLPTNSTIDFDNVDLPGALQVQSEQDLRFDGFDPRVAELLKRLIELEVIDQRDVSVNTTKLKAETANTLGGQLEQLELLTKFQVEEIAARGVDALLVHDYILLEPLGKGGMGVVYRARHRRMDRLVALKTLHSAALDQPEALDRFRREVKAAARLSHANIVQAFDAGDYAGMHYLVMEFVDGHDLARIVRERGPISARRAVHYIAQAAKGLAYAHQQGVIHRDIKPQNLLVDGSHRVRILDLGLARLNSNTANDPDQDAGQLTKSGVIMGTVDFMAPEQAVNTKLANERSDIYSLGCTLHFLLTGTTMYQGETFAERLLAHHNEPQPSLTAVNTRIPQIVEDVFLRMTAKRPEDRFGTMDEVEAELIAIFKQLNARPTTSKPARPIPVVETEPESADEFDYASAVAQTQIVAEETAVSTRPPQFEGQPRSSGRVELEPERITTNEFAVPSPTDVNSQLADEEHSRTGAIGLESAANEATREEPPVLLTPLQPKPTVKQRSGLKPALIGATVGLIALVGVIAFWPNNDGDSPESGPQAGQAKARFSTRDSKSEMAGLQNSNRKQPDYDWPTAKEAQTRQLAIASEYGMTPFVKNTLGMELAFIPATNQDRAFLISTTEVTIKQFAQFVDEEGYELQAQQRFGRRNGVWESGDYDFRNLGELAPDPEFPAGSICFYDAQAFCRWLSKSEEARYRLPTTDEWLHAFKAYASTAFFWGDDPDDAGKYAVVAGEFETYQRVRSKLPNPFGIYDQIGNEAEWCGFGNEWLPTGAANPSAYQLVRNLLRPKLGGSFGTSLDEIAEGLNGESIPRRPPFFGGQGAFRVIRELD